MRLRSKSSAVRVDEENPYWMSFSDLMSGLLVVFILASVALIIQLTEAQVQFEQEMQEQLAELNKEQDKAKRLQEEAKRREEETLQLQEKLKRREEETLQLQEKLKQREKEVAALKKLVRDDIAQLQNAEKARSEILYTIKATLAEQNIVVEVVDNDTVLRIPENTLSFNSNSYDIPDSANVQESIKKIGLALHKAILEPLEGKADQTKRFEYLDTVFIEGHTDSRTTKRIKGNWGLSTFRAISLWEFWEKSLDIQPGFDEMQNTFEQKLFSVSGYADSRRLQLVEDTPNQRAANRRIDIRFTVKRPSIEDLEAIIKQ